MPRVDGGVMLLNMKWKSISIFMIVAHALLIKHEVKMAGYWQSSFSHFIKKKSRSIKTQKRKHPISSPLHQSSFRVPTNQATGFTSSCPLTDSATMYCTMKYGTIHSSLNPRDSRLDSQKFSKSLEPRDLILVFLYFHSFEIFLVTKLFRVWLPSWDVNSCHLN